MAKRKVETKRGVTPVGVASFPELFHAKRVNADDPKEDPKFRLTLVFKPQEMDDANKARFDELIANVNHVCREELTKLACFTDEQRAAFEAALAATPDKPLKAHYAAFKALTWKTADGPKAIRSPFLLGKDDQYMPDDSIFIRLSTQATRPPAVVGLDAKTPCEEVEIYAGALLRVSYTAYPYDNLGNRGVTLYLGNVQKVGAGTRLGGGPPPEEEFDAVEAEDVAF